MGLDATVYCNCYESGQARMPPPRPDMVYVDDCGATQCRDGGQDEIYSEFHRWLHDQACGHIDGVLLHHRIGNIALIATLRAELQRNNAAFPLLLGKMLYSGTHAGDSIDVRTVRAMARELGPLSQLHADDLEIEGYIRSFEKQMSELIQRALAVNKPISF